MAVGVATHANPALLGRAQREAYLTQPNVMGEAALGALQFTGTLNFEGYTLGRGELNAGIYGEGYVDRRHPHTLVHELMVAATTPRRFPLRASLAAGKGFTPYGTDDPMMRPFVKYPVNHHHAQIIERVQVHGALQAGTSSRHVTLEQAWFNGDEPTGPFDAPQWSRVGDSRSTRVTASPARGLELQGSHAFVRSPGIIQGGAFDHRQTSVSLRFDRVSQRGASEHHASHDADAMAGMEHAENARYLLLEYARTEEGEGRQTAFRYESVLAEGMLSWRGWRMAARAERTDRPESERLLDLFRTANGHVDFQIIGITRFTVGTVQIGAPPLHVRAARTMLMPFVEVAQARPRALRLPTVFEPREFYGASALWSISAGVRVQAGTMRSRMGRYGVLR